MIGQETDTRKHHYWMDDIDYYYDLLFERWFCSVSRKQLTIAILATKMEFIALCSVTKED